MSKYQVKNLRKQNSSLQTQRAFRKKSCRYFIFHDKLSSTKNQADDRWFLKTKKQSATSHIM